ncbi:MAG TPA: hypothetical protein ENN79_03390 [Desulfobacteraceae bacterium]|nr:hypothetical protein [Desulfobacteraceae bacterium]
MIAEKISDAELKKKALVLLNQTLGPANTVRFLRMYSAGTQDYMAIRDELFKDMSAKQVFEEAAAFWQSRSGAES